MKKYAVRFCNVIWLYEYNKKLKRYENIKILNSSRHDLSAILWKASDIESSNNAIKHWEFADTLEEVEMLLMLRKL